MKFFCYYKPILVSVASLKTYSLATFSTSYSGNISGKQFFRKYYFLWIYCKSINLVQFKEKFHLVTFETLQILLRFLEEKIDGK